MDLVTDHEIRLGLRKKHMTAVPLHLIPSLLALCATDSWCMQVLTTDSTELENKPSHAQEILLLHV